MLRSTKQRTTNLDRSPQRQAHTTAPKQRRGRTIILTKIEIDIGSVLVRSTKAVLRAKRVTLRRAEVVDLDDDGMGAVECVPGGVGLRSQLIAGTAGWAGAEEVL